MRLVIVLIIVCVSTPGLTGETVALPGGGRVTLDRCHLTLEQGSHSIWSTLLECPDTPKEGQMTLYNLGDGKLALHIKFPTGKRDGFHEYVLVCETLARGFRIVWHKETGFLGDLGERITPMVRFQDLSGDGLPEIVEGTASEAVNLCGKKDKPLLFRRVYDWKRGTFRPVLAKRVGIGEKRDIVGHFLPGEGPTKSLVDQIVPLSVSRSAGDRNDPILLSPPQALVDRDPKTAWMPTPENGAGEFATLKTLAHLYGVTRVGIRPLPAVKRPVKYDRPRSLFLSTEEGVYRLVFPSDPLGSPEKTIWFDLPAPVYSRCFSIIVESSYAKSPRTPLALAEIFLITEADGQGGLQQLAQDLNSPQKRRQAAQLLERAGPQSVKAIRSFWTALDLEGKQRAVTVLANTDPGGAVDLLCDAALNGDGELGHTARRGIEQAGDAAVPILDKYLDTVGDEGFETVVEILASLGTTKALGVLANRLGQGGRRKRATLRMRLGQMGQQREENASYLFVLTQEAKRSGHKEALLDLLRALAAVPASAVKIARVANEMYSPEGSFDDRYRLLELFGRLRCQGNREHLLSSASDRDHLIRAAAIRGLGACVKGRKSAVDIARQALQDVTVEVRLAALNTLKRLGVEADFEEAVTGLATGDPWPEIRAVSTDLSAQFRQGVILRILTATQADGSPLVRTATVKTVAKLKGDQADRIIEGFLKNDNEESRIQILAAAVAARRCQRSAVPLLFTLLKRGAEPLAKKKEVDVAQASARALGIIGGAQALEYLSTVKRRSNPATDRAIDSALAKPSTFCPAQ